MKVSVIVPVYNEEEVLPQLFARLYPAMDALDVPYEIVFVNDGSKDKSAAMLKDQYLARREVTKLVLFNGNFGQHCAILAGFAQAEGERIVTIDADLQNPPEEIGKLLAAMDAGHDYVGSYRMTREDSLWRFAASRMMNAIRHRITKIKMTDQGCMMRAYSRPIVEAINATQEVSTFIPALAFTFAHNPTEVGVTHAERAAGESKYSFYKLMRLNFDLMTGFSLVPLQMFSMIGMLLSVFSALFVVYLAIRRLVVGPEAEGVFTLFGITFFLIGILLFGVGLLGEYIGRIYQQVRNRPRYIIDAVLRPQPHSLPAGTADIPSTRNLA